MEDIELPDLPSNILNVLRRIRRCENEVAAQVVLEHALRAYALADREKRAQAAQVDHPPCKGENCGITRLDQEHSPECIAEHERACSGAELDTPGNRHPEFRYAGYKNQALQNGATADQKLAYEEGKRAQFTEASKPVQAEAPSTLIDRAIQAGGLLMSDGEVSMDAESLARFATKQAEAPTASNAEREENPIETMERLGFMFALDEETREQADKLASALRGSRVNYQIEQAAADMLWKLSSALATQQEAQPQAEPMKPNLFWNHDDPEIGETSIHDVIDREWNGGCLKHGDVMEIQQAVSLPNIKVRLIPSAEHGEDYFDFEIIDDAARAAQQATDKKGGV